MHQFLPETHESFIALELSGKLDSHDYETILPIIRKTIEQHGKVRLFWEMKNFDGWTLDGLWADGSFDIKHAKDFSRVAIVGEKKWHEWMTKAMKPFTSAEVRYFDLGQREAAMDWARGPETAA
jgi:hypothetical protein